MEKEKEKVGLGDTEEKTPEERQQAETQEAETRQVYNPVEKTYDARKLKATDLEINTRVTIPKGLPESHEAWLEVRRTKYEQVCNKYIGENCKDNGEQKPNLTKDEMKCLISLKKRIKEGSVVVMCTDKSNKYAITELENYKTMG